MEYVHRSWMCPGWKDKIFVIPLFHLLMFFCGVTVVTSTCVTKLEYHTKEVCFHEQCVNMTYTRLATHCSSVAAVPSTISVLPSSMESVPFSISSPSIVPSSAPKSNLSLNISSTELVRSELSSMTVVNNLTQSIYPSQTKISSTVNSESFQNGRTVTNSDIFTTVNRATSNNIFERTASSNTLLLSSTSSTQYFRNSNVSLASQISRSLSPMPTMNIINTTLNNLPSMSHVEQNTTQIIFITSSKQVQASSFNNSSMVSRTYISPSDISIVSSSEFINSSQRHKTRNLNSSVFISTVYGAVSSTSSNVAISKLPITNSSAVIMPSTPYSTSLSWNKTESSVRSSKIEISLVLPTRTPKSNSSILQNKTESLVRQSLVLSTKTHSSNSSLLQNKTEALVMQSTKIRYSTILPTKAPKTNSSISQNKTESLLVQSSVLSTKIHKSNSSLLQNKTESLVAQSTEIRYSSILPTRTPKTNSSISQNKTESLVVQSSVLSTKTHKSNSSLLQNKTESLVAQSTEIRYSSILPTRTPKTNSSISQNKTESLVVQSSVLSTKTHKSNSSLLQNKTKSVVTQSSKIKHSSILPTRTPKSNSSLIQNETESLPIPSTKVIHSSVKPSRTHISNSSMLQSKTISLATISSKNSHSFVEPSMPTHSDFSVLRNKTESVTLSTKISQSLVLPSPTTTFQTVATGIYVPCWVTFHIKLNTTTDIAKFTKAVSQISYSNTVRDTIKPTSYVFKPTSSDYTNTHLSSMNLSGTSKGVMPTLLSTNSTIVSLKPINSAKTTSYFLSLSRTIIEFSSSLYVTKSLKVVTSSSKNTSKLLWNATASLTSAVQDSTLTFSNIINSSLFTTNRFAAISTPAAVLSSFTFAKSSFNTSVSLHSSVLHSRNNISTSKLSVATKNSSVQVLPSSTTMVFMNLSTTATSNASSFSKSLNKNSSFGTSSALQSSSLDASSIVSEISSSQATLFNVSLSTSLQSFSLTNNTPALSSSSKIGITSLMQSGAASTNVTSVKNSESTLIKSSQTGFSTIPKHSAINYSANLTFGNISLSTATVMESSFVNLSILNLSTQIQSTSKSTDTGRNSATAFRASVFISESSLPGVNITSSSRVLSNNTIIAKKRRRRNVVLNNSTDTISVSSNLTISTLYPSISVNINESDNGKRMATSTSFHASATISTISLLPTSNQYSSVIADSSYNGTKTSQNSIKQTNGSSTAERSSIISLQSTSNNTLMVGLHSSTPVVVTENHMSHTVPLTSITISLHGSSNATKRLSLISSKTSTKSSSVEQTLLSTNAENQYLTSTLGLCWIPFTTIVPVTSFPGMVSSQFFNETSRLFTASSSMSTANSSSLHLTQLKHTPFTSITVRHQSSKTFVTVMSVTTIPTLLTSLSGTYRKNTSIHSLPSLNSSVSSLITLDSSVHFNKTTLTTQTQSISMTATTTRTLLNTKTVNTLPIATSQWSSYVFETLVTSASILYKTTTLNKRSDTITTSKQWSHSKTASQTIAMSSSFSVQASSSVSIQPTVLPTNNNLILSIIVSELVDVQHVDFKSSLEQKLVDTYVRMKSISRFRRSASNGDATVEIIETTRKGENVDVEYKVQENGVDVPAKQAVSVYNYLSVSGLEKQLGYKVVSPISAASVSSRYQLTDILGIVLAEDRSDYNLSFPANQQDFELKMVQIYKNIQNYSNVPVSVKIIYVKHELHNTVYIEFYVLVNGAVQNATYVAAAFKASTLTALSGELGEQISSLPYVANGYFSGSTEQGVRMVIQPLLSSTDVSTQSYKNRLEVNIANIYIDGKTKGNRKRRATGSVIAQIELLTTINTYQVETVFVLRDQGVVQNGNVVADTMNKVSEAEMRTILSATVIKKPEPLVLPPSPVTSDPPYWIIAAATVPVVFIALICVLCCWRWKRGGPQPKVSPEQIEMEERGTGKEGPIVDDKREEPPPIKEKEIIQEKIVPTYSPEPTSYIPSDVRRSSQRRKIQSLRKPNAYGRQNQGYDVNDDYEDDIEEEEEESEEETEEEIIIVRKPSPKPKDTEVRRKLDYDAVDGRQNGVQNGVLEKPPRPMPRSPIPQDVHRRPLELTANQMETDGVIKPVHVPMTYTAGRIESFGRMQETRGMTPNPPVRFRTNIENDMEAYTKPTGPLPVLDLQQTSLVAAASPREPMQTDPDFQHKSEVERLRNKQRQRDQLFGVTQNLSSDNQSLLNKNQQDAIDAVLDPVNANTISDLSQRKSRLRRRLRRKNKIYITPEPKHQQRQMKNEDVLLKSYQEIPKEKDMTSDKTEDISETESDISSREANRRIRALIDDTFTTLKKYKETLNYPEKTSPSKRNEHITSSTPRRYAGMPPALPDPPPSHGRATAIPPGHGRPRDVAPNPFAYPYNNAYGAPLADPMVTWDPLERQRYVNQRLGYPVYGPVASSLTMPYGPSGQNVYMTPLQQRPDGMGGVVWSPYAMNETMGDTGAFKPLDPVYTPVPGQNSLPRKPNDFKMEHATTLDMSDVGGLKKSTNSQPLIRAIKEELLKLSQNAQGKTKITELRHSEAPTAS